MAVKACEQCAAEFTAQRSTRRYCSEACKQRAKRARQWAAQWQHVPPEAKCQHCRGLLFPGKAERDNIRLAAAHPWWTHRRKYCSDRCRKAARSYRYRVAPLPEDSPYRVADSASGPCALDEPAPCWRSAEWHELARLVLAAMEKGWALAPPPDQDQTWVIDLALAREIAASQRSGPWPGDAHADREVSPSEQENPASQDADSGPVRAAGHSVQADASDSGDDPWEEILRG